MRERAITVDVSAVRGYGVHRAPVAKLARAALALACEPPVELSVALVGDDEMRRLNATYRHKDRTTDVLAFSQREGEHADAASALLGDVVISLPVATRQASERGHPVARELAELLVHGILHLLGYDHERSPADARKMFARARQVMSGLEAAGAVRPVVERGPRPAKARVAKTSARAKATKGRATPAPPRAPR